jgi:hypothetical protein
MSRGSSCLEVEKNPIEPATITKVFLPTADMLPDKPDSGQAHRSVLVYPFRV